MQPYCFITDESEKLGSDNIIHHKQLRAFFPIGHWSVVLGVFWLVSCMFAIHTDKLDFHNRSPTAVQTSFLILHSQGYILAPFCLICRDLKNHRYFYYFD